MQLNISSELLEEQQTLMDRDIGGLNLFDTLDHAIKKMLALDTFRRFKSNLSSDVTR